MCTTSVIRYVQHATIQQIVLEATLGGVNPTLSLKTVVTLHTGHITAGHGLLHSSSYILQLATAVCPYGVEASTLTGPSPQSKLHVHLSCWGSACMRKESKA